MSPCAPPKAHSQCTNPMTGAPVLVLRMREPCRTPKLMLRRKDRSCEGQDTATPSPRPSTSSAPTSLPVFMMMSSPEVPSGKLQHRYYCHDCTQNNKDIYKSESNNDGDGVMFTNAHMLSWSHTHPDGVANARLLYDIRPCMRDPSRVCKGSPDVVGTAAKLPSQKGKKHTKCLRSCVVCTWCVVPFGASSFAAGLAMSGDPLQRWMNTAASYIPQLRQVCRRREEEERKLKKQQRTSKRMRKIGNHRFASNGECSGVLQVSEWTDGWTHTARVQSEGW